MAQDTAFSCEAMSSRALNGGVISNAEFVESGEAPGRINAAHLDGGAESIRPLCAYPQVAVYTSGAVSSDAASFQCL